MRPLLLSRPEQPCISTSAGRGAFPSGRLRCAVKLVLPSSETKFTVCCAAATVATADSASASNDLGSHESHIDRPYHGPRGRGSGAGGPLQLLECPGSRRAPASSPPRKRHLLRLADDVERRPRLG